MKDLVALVVFKKGYPHKYEDEESSYGSSEYSYFTDIKDLKKDDVLVVDTQYGPAIAKFVGYTSNIKSVANATKWIIQKVDLENHKKRLQAIEQKAMLIEEMRNLRDTHLELELFAKLAESNPVMKSLLEKFNSL